MIGARRRGYTLIEITIVASIVGVIFAMALPNLIEARTDAEATRLLEDIEVIRKAWVTALATGDGLTSPKYARTNGERDSHGSPITRAAPEPLLPMLKNLAQTTRTVSVLERDEQGRPVVVTDAQGHRSVRSKPVEFPQFAGPEGLVYTTYVTVRTDSASGNADLMFDRLKLPRVCVAIEVRSSKPNDVASKILAIVNARLKERGGTVFYLIGSLSFSNGQLLTMGAAQVGQDVNSSRGHIIYYFVP